MIRVSSLTPWLLAGCLVVSSAIVPQSILACPSGCTLSKAVGPICTKKFEEEDIGSCSDCPTWTSQHGEACQLDNLFGDNIWKHYITENAYGRQNYAQGYCARTIEFKCGETVQCYRELVPSTGQCVGGELEWICVEIRYDIMAPVIDPC
jgi:hypothetical protein